MFWAGWYCLQLLLDQLHNNNTEFHGGCLGGPGHYVVTPTRVEVELGCDNNKLIKIREKKRKILIKSGFFELLCLQYILLVILVVFFCCLVFSLLVCCLSHPAHMLHLLFIFSGSLCLVAPMGVLLFEVPASWCFVLCQYIQVSHCCFFWYMWTVCDCLNFYLISLSKRSNETINQLLIFLLFEGVLFLVRL